jgi:galactitol-specific phosphotransferase system IIB component
MRRILFSVLLVASLTAAASFAGSSQEVKDPVKEAARKLDKQVKAQNLKELKEAAAELVTLSKELNDEVEKSGENVISARIFNKVEQIEKAAKRIRDKAKGPYGL